MRVNVECIEPFLLVRIAESCQTDEANDQLPSKRHILDTIATFHPAPYDICLFVEHLLSLRGTGIMLHCATPEISRHMTHISVLHLFLVLVS